MNVPEKLRIAPSLLSADFSKLGQYWQQNEPSVDIAPLPLGDSVVNLEDIAVLADTWLINQ